MKSRSRGLSLIELMVALTIGSLLIAGAVLVYSQSRSTYRVSDSVARLQENARYALSIIEPDVQLAGYYGFSNKANGFSFVRGGSTSGVPASGLRPDSDAVDLGGTDAHACGRNFAVNLVATVEGTNDNYGLACTPAFEDANTPGAIAYLPGTDRLTIRRASVASASERPGMVQLVTNRLSPANAYIISDGVLPGTGTMTSNLVDVRDIVVRSYYIANASERPRRPGLPALRVKTLEQGPKFTDTEVISGVEDLQVQFGIERGLDMDNDGEPDEYTGAAVRYVNPGDVPPNYRVVSVRIWLLMRAEQPEAGYVNTAKYVYAGKPEYVPGDAFRRVLVSRTIHLRNSRTM